MNAAEAIAFAALVFGIIGALGVVGEVYKRRLAFKERELELFASQTAEKAAQYAAQAERLEQRVAVLERIATDKSGDLAREIEDLRKQGIN